MFCKVKRFITIIDIPNKTWCIDQYLLFDFPSVVSHLGNDSILR